MILFLWMAIAQAQIVNLQSAYLAALEKTEPTQIQDAKVQQFAERKSQSVSGILPRLNFIASGTLQDRPADAPRALQDPLQTNARINLSQTILHGPQDFNLISVASSNLDAQKSLATAAKLNLYQNVSQVFYLVAQNEKDLEDLKLILKLAEDRVAELDKRSKIGRSRRTELLAAQSQKYTIEAQIKLAEGNLEQSKDQFHFVTGLPRDSKLNVDQRLPKKIEPIENFLEQAKRRPDLNALESQLNAASAQTDAARAGHWPFLDLSSNYYLKRAGFQQSSKWDVGVSLTFPLYQGGIISAQAGEAASLERQQTLVLSQARRGADRDIRQAYQSLSAGIQQIETLQLGYETANETYKQQKRDYGFGMATNLDVLQALDSLQDLKRTLDRTYFQTLIAWVNLQTATGKMP